MCVCRYLFSNELVFMYVIYKYYRYDLNIYRYTYINIGIYVFLYIFFPGSDERQRKNLNEKAQQSAHIFTKDP